MLIILIIAGVCIFGVMSYLALSKKSSFKVRAAALVSLGVMVLAVIICLIVILSTGISFKNSRSSSSDFPIMPYQSQNNSFLLIGSIIFLFILFMLILVFSLREQRRMKK